MSQGRTRVNRRLDGPGPRNGLPDHPAFMQHFCCLLCMRSVSWMQLELYQKRQEIDLQDIIQREIKITAPKEKIYDAIANPDKVVQWFPNTVEGSYAKGEQPIFDFGEDGKDRVYIVDAVPHEYFAFRWVPGSSNYTGDLLAVKTTLVEFRIHEEQDGICTVTMTESGFASLPTAIMDKSYRENSEGWGPMLNRLSTYCRTL